ncbi:hypothetical protein ABG067_007524 [Albugo candida]
MRKQFFNDIGNGSGFDPHSQWKITDFENKFLLNFPPDITPQGKPQLPQPSLPIFHPEETPSIKSQKESVE